MQGPRGVSGRCACKSSTGAFGTCVRATHSVYAGSHGQEEAAASAEFVEEKQVLVGTCATTQGVNVVARDAHCVAGITNARSSHTRIKHSIHQPGPKLGKMFSVISDSLCNHGQQTGSSADNDWVHAYARWGGGYRCCGGRGPAFSRGFFPISATHECWHVVTFLVAISPLQLALIFCRARPRAPTFSCFLSGNETP